MSSGPVQKRRKFYGSNKKNKFNNYQSKRNRYLEPGFRGFMITCNFREKDCVRDCYIILNEYAKQWPEEPSDQPEKVEEDQNSMKVEEPSKESDDNDSDESEDEPEDISSQLENEIQSAIKNNSKKDRQFQQVDTGTQNCLFIKTTMKDPVGFGVKIVRDLAETKVQKSRYLLRLLPIECVCRANVDDIKNAAGKLFDKYFLNTPAKTFSIVVNKRYNNNVDKFGIIRELADIIAFKSVDHKVNLGDPQVTVIVEIIKGLCCLSVIPDYLKLKKYNLAELAAKDNEDKKKDQPASEGDPKPTEGDPKPTEDDPKPTEEPNKTEETV